MEYTIRYYGLSWHVFAGSPAEIVWARPGQLHRTMLSAIVTARRSLVDALAFCTGADVIHIISR